MLSAISKHKRVACCPARDVEDSLDVCMCTFVEEKACTDHISSGYAKCHAIASMEHVGVMRR